jgi:hypothetical protein
MFRYFVFNDNNPLEERNLVRKEELTGRVRNHVVNEVGSDLQGGRHSLRSLCYRSYLRARPVGRDPIVEHPAFTT